MRIRLFILLSLLTLLCTGCPKPDPDKGTKPANTSPTPMVEETGTCEHPVEITTSRLTNFSYNPALFNDLFMKSPIITLSSGEYCLLKPSTTKDTNGNAKGKIDLVKYRGAKETLLQGMDANNWHLKATPDSSKISWLSWKTSDDKDTCYLMTMSPTEGQPPAKAYPFPNDALVIDYFWLSNQYVYALLVYDADFKDVRLAVIDMVQKTSREIITTNGYNFLKSRDTYRIASSISFSPSMNIGFFSAMGSIFAFKADTGKGGLYLDGAGMFFLSSPVISEDGKFLNFQAIASGDEKFVNCYFDINRKSFFALLDRKTPLSIALTDQLFTTHNFFFNGKYNLDFTNNGNGVVSLESQSDKQILFKTDSSSLSLFQGRRDEFLSFSTTGINLHRLRFLNFEKGFVSQAYQTPKVQIAKYPDFSSPEGSIRTYLSSFKKMDPEIWSVCVSDTTPLLWIREVGVTVGKRSLRMIGDFRHYTRLTNDLTGKDKVMLKGELHVFGDHLGSDVISLIKMNRMWLVDKISAVEK